MKRICFILLLMVTQITMGQVILKEGFESWPPNWQILELGDAIYGWRQDYDGTAFQGEHSAYSSINNAQCDNWLVSNGIQIANGDYQLKFWEISNENSIEYYDSATVLISQGSSDPMSGDFIPVYETELNTSAWQQRSIDLSAFENETIYVAFRYTGTYHSWFIDEVSVTPFAFTDVKMDAFTTPNGVTETPDSQSVKVQVTNNGTTVINTLAIDWSVNETAQATAQFEGLNLAPNTSVELTLGDYDFSTNGFYNLEAEVSTDDDFEALNNQVASLYQVSPFNDAAIINMSPEGMSPVTGLADVKVTIQNQGSNPIREVIIDWSVDAETSFTYANDNLALEPGASTEVVLGNYNFDTGSFNIGVTVHALGDTNAANDAYEASYTVDTFMESFEGRQFPPEGWSINFGVRDNSNFGVAADGEYFYSSQVDENYFGTVTDTIFTPVMDIKEGDRFRFYIKSSMAYPIANTLVWKNEATGEIETISTIQNSQGFNNWELRDYDISAAAGANRIGIVGLPNGSFGDAKFDLFSSDAKLFQYENDLRVLSVKSNFIARQGVEQEFEVVLRNAGESVAAARGYQIHLKNEEGTILNTYGGTLLSSWEEVKLSLAHTFTELGTQKVYVEVEMADDENPMDNKSFSYTIGVVPETAIVSEIGTKDNTSPAIPFTANGNTNTLGEDDLTQLLYYQDEIGSAGYAYGMTYTYKNLLASSDTKSYPLKIWIRQTDRVELSEGWEDIEQMTLVFDGVIDIFPGDDNELYIPFDEPVLLNGINNVVVQNYQYDPEWPPSIFRMYGTLGNDGPTRTIGVLDAFDLDPNSPPEYFFELSETSFTRFIIDPSTDFSSMIGVVSDADSGTTISGASIELVDAAVSTNSESDGAYAFESLPFGNYTFRISADGYETKTVTIDLNSSNQTEDFNLNLLLELEVTGTVYGDNNISIPLEAVTLNLRLEDDTIETTVSTDASGTFLFPLVYGTFNYEVEVLLYGYYPKIIEVNPTDSNIDLGDVILEEEFISAFEVAVDNSDEGPRLSWKSPKTSKKEQRRHDSGTITTSYTNEPNENVWLGNYFNFESPTTLNTVEIQTDIFQNAEDYVTIDVVDIVSDEVLASSAPFLIKQNAQQTIDIPNITVSGLIAVMVHWQDNAASTNSLAIEYADSGGDMFDGAVIKYPNESTTLFTSFIGAVGYSAAFLLRVNTLTEDNPITNGEVMTYNVYRGLASSFPNTDSWDLLNQNAVEGLDFLDEVPGADSGEFYRYAVECIYANGTSEVTFSNSISGASLGIDENPWQESDLRLFPNPAHGSAELHLAAGMRLDGPIECYDLLGKLVRSIDYKSHSTSQKIDLNGLSNGVYILRCALEDGATITKKLIVN